MKLYQHVLLKLILVALQGLLYAGLAWIWVRETIEIRRHAGQRARY